MTTALTFSHAGSDPRKQRRVGWVRRAVGVLAARWAAAVFAAAMAAAVTLISGGVAMTGAPAGKATPPAEDVGVFTGEYANGIPVYRLPAVTVVASRRAELAKMDQEERRLRAIDVPLDAAAAESRATGDRLAALQTRAE